MPFPMDLPISGIRFAPKSRMMIKRDEHFCGPMLNMAFCRLSEPAFRAVLRFRSVRLRPPPRVTAHDDRESIISWSRLAG